ncbi:uncharacterized protein J2128_000506 [Methanomicrobium sp. W14]|uniref:HDIG domain-containing metalloprotein n=1 Tax=Methanomicrobium sp. W14 TaxID=2817839 RepID=UPI001AE55DD1|nr:HDIG domain-containing metalloprotein [Methanomicrobium sp. W14]MBP2132585.1 uncharacterized protein [Methanomicrobium sp. W14]
MNTDSDCFALLREAGCEEKVIEHCIAVRDLSVVYAVNAGADVGLVNAGALLHDIGRSKSHAIDHGQIGAMMCRKMGLPEKLCLIIERHVGAGLSAEECREMGLVQKDCIPLSLEEKIVAHCDNLIKGKTEISVEERLKLSQSSGHSQKSIERLLALCDEIEKYRVKK